MPDDKVGQGDEMARRARGVAAGLADVGLTRAEELLRRLSPEGRAQARREKEARARRQKRLLFRLALASAASLLVWAVLAAFLVPGAAMAIAAAMMVLLGALIVARADPSVRGRAALAEAALPDLATETTIWLAAQRRGLPAPAVQLADMLSRRLDELAPQTVRLDARSPAADAVRKLIATELPDLVDGWRAVPIHRRSLPQADGRTPDGQLTDGLRLIDAELGRITDQLASGSLNTVAVQKRYLELKYGDGGTD